VRCRGNYQQSHIISSSSTCRAHVQLTSLAAAAATTLIWPLALDQLPLHLLQLMQLASKCSLALQDAQKQLQQAVGSSRARLAMLLTQQEAAAAAAAATAAAAAAAAATRTAAE
jgi:hypothetical protein